MTTTKTTKKSVALLSLFALTGGMVLGTPIAANAEDGYTLDGQYYLDAQADEFGGITYIFPAPEVGLPQGATFFNGGQGGGGTAGGGIIVSSDLLDIRSYFYDSDARAQGSGSRSTEKFIQWGGVGTQPSANLRTACASALRKADQRGRDAGIANPTSRVVGIMWGHVKNNPDVQASRTPGWYYDLLNAWRDSGYSNISGQSRTILNKIYNAGVEGIEEASGGRGNTKELYNADYPTSVCIALNNETEPALNYDLTISTDKAQVFTHGGGTTAVNDMIHASRSGAINENLQGTVTLRWSFDGLTKTASKAVTFPNNGDTRSPDFFPADLNGKWKKWPQDGEYSFKVEVPKQGKMKNPVTHNAGFNDPRQTWRVFHPDTPDENPEKVIVSPGTKNPLDGKVLANVQSYDARISASALGYRSIELKDIILQKNVKIGAKDRDDLTQVRVEDEAGTVVDSTINVEETPEGRTVTARVNLGDDADVTGTYTLVVPTFVQPTGEDYDVDDSGQACYIPRADGEAFCKDTERKHTEKVTPKPNKAWVLDPQTGELVSDPNWTNKVGSDERVFIQGEEVWTLVEDILPANLDQALVKYIIWDQPQDTETYIDWTGAENTAKVTVNGVDYTSSFDFVRDGAKVTATAKAGSAFLTMTKGLDKATKVHFYHKGTFRTDYDTNAQLIRLVNTAGVQWNDEEKPTNTPPIYTWTPPRDKSWSRDMAEAISTADPNWTNQTGADNKIFIQGGKVAAVVNTLLSKDLARNLKSMSLVDDWTAGAQYIDFNDPTSARVYADGVDVTDQFTIVNNGTTTVATAKPEYLALTGSFTKDVKYQFIIQGTFKRDYDTQGDVRSMVNAGHFELNGNIYPTNEPSTFTWTPKPNKVWILDGSKAFDADDPDWTNRVAADEKIFLKGDTVGAVVNTIVKKDLARDLEEFIITDDWTDAGKYADLSDTSRARVYIDGVDVTSKFTITNEGTISKATAKPEWLETTAELDKDIEVKFVIEGTFKQDYETHGALVSMENRGSLTIDGNVYPTNKPVVYTWTPDPKKDVIGSKDQDGTQESIHTMNVIPGQKIEYKVDLDLRIPETLANEIESFAFEDSYDPKFIPNKSSLEFYDARDNSVISRKNYTTTWDDSIHSLSVVFDPEWVKKFATSTTTEGWLIARFDGVVDKSAEDGYEVKNQAFQILNKSRTKTNEVKVTVPPFTPHKEDLNTKGDNIDGKTVIKGDKIVYRLSLDATPARDVLAYDVHKLGMWDKFDAEYLDLTEKDVTVQDAAGTDATDKFNIAVIGDTVYVFFKHVDRENANGETIKGTQPEDLAAYSQNEKIDPINDPIIDQSVLGQVYRIHLAATVKKSTDGYTIVNKAFQNFENRIKATEVVSNPLKEINPSKDVNVLHDKVSINDQSVKINHSFNYQFKSSTIPANRAYETSSWGIRDQINTSIDNYTGKWSVYAETDIYNNQELLFKKGDKIDSNELAAGYFEHSWDEGTSTVVLTATEKFRAVLNTRLDLPVAWAAYVQMIRVAPGEVENTLTEFYNDVDRPSNTVVTRTKVNPKIDLEKFDVPSGEIEGDRDTADAALIVPEGKAAIGFKITNTGDVDLVGLNFSDVTVEGTGSVKNIQFPDEFLKNPVLMVGETIYAYGDLEDVEEGTSHKDTAKVVAYPKYAKTCPPGTVLNPNASDNDSDSAQSGESTPKDCLPICDSQGTSVDGSNPNHCVKVCEPKAETPGDSAQSGDSDKVEPDNDCVVPPAPPVETCDESAALIPDGSQSDAAQSATNGGKYGSPCKPSRVEVCPATDLAGVQPEGTNPVEGDKTKFCAEPVSDSDDFHAKRPEAPKPPVPPVVVTPPPVLAKTGANFTVVLAAALMIAVAGGALVKRRSR